MVTLVTNNKQPCPYPRFVDTGQYHVGSVIVRRGAAQLHRDCHIRRVQNYQVQLIKPKNQLFGATKLEAA
jgi:hypothetical protein